MSERNADLWYPRNTGTDTVSAIRVRLFDVRAAPDLIVTYDFERDGYSIAFEDPEREPVFLPAWPPDTP